MTSLATLKCRCRRPALQPGVRKTLSPSTTPRHGKPGVQSHPLCSIQAKKVPCRPGHKKWSDSLQTLDLKRLVLTVSFSRKGAPAVHTTTPTHTTTPRPQDTLRYDASLSILHTHFHPHLHPVLSLAAIPHIHIHTTRRVAYGWPPASFHTHQHFTIAWEATYLHTGRRVSPLQQCTFPCAFSDPQRSHMYCSASVPARRYEPIEITLRNQLSTVKLLNLL